MSAKENCVVKVGSRKSELALIQTRYVISLLKKLYPEKEFEIVTMTTLGDRVLNISLPKIGEKSLFTKDLEEALACGSVDLVVHSLKDLPTTLPQGMAIGAVLEREDPRDALVLREDFKGHTLSTLPAGSIIGTSSLRRTAQLSRNHPHLKVLDIRGNLNTRLRKLDMHCKLDAGSEVDCNTTGADKSIPNYAALILAQAGLVRMGWEDRISQVLSCKEVLYAIGQGALAIECRANNHQLLQMLAPLNHEDTYCRILTERTFLRTLGGGCSAPVAISTNFETISVTNGNNDCKKKLTVTGAVWSLDGKTKIQESLSHEFGAIISDLKPKCPFESKNKSGKHKLLDVEDLTASSEQPDLKQTKLDNGNTCLNKMKAQENAGETKKFTCCKQGSINLTLDKAEPIEIENLINIHGKLFMSCPFSDPESGSCPMKFPVGQEVMGQCPYYMEEQVEISQQLVRMHPRRPVYDIKKCPFMFNQVVSINAQLQTNHLTGEVSTSSYDVEKEPNAQNCPFLKRKNGNPSECLTENTINKITETNTTLIEENANPELTSKSADEDIRLYCGLTKHHNLMEDVMDKCEDMGKELAHILIEQGALDVMKCAQDFIRGSIPTGSAIISQ